jgi:hypothetical protein
MSYRPFLFSLAFGLLAALGPAQAEDWPARPVTVVHLLPASVPNSPCARPTRR